MIELAEHIEALLLENDCVIVPGFGGFVTHYASSVRVKEENIFLPPTRSIGFNPQLKMNDGILVQSYMAVYDTNFPDATRMVEKQVNELIAILHKEGKCDLPDIGEIRYTIYDTYEFVPYNEKITTPCLYGLDSFEMEELSSIKATDEKKVIFPVPQQEKRLYEIRVNRAFLRNAVAMIAAVALFFFMSTPVENTYVEKGNYAQLLPADLFEKIEKQSVAMTPIVVKTTQDVVAKTSPKKKANAKPVAVKEVKVTSATEVKPAAVDKSSKQPVVSPVVPAVKVQPSKTEGKYHIIIASVATAVDAEVMAEQYRAKGFSSAKALVGDGKARVSLLSCPTREDATKELLKLRKDEAYQNAWMLTKK